MAFRYSPIFRYTVRGDSMQPTYKPGDKVYINRLAYFFKKPKVGDIVILQHPAQNIRVIKRISKITPTGYFVAGDNGHYSTDSRHFGAIKRRNIIRKVYVKTKPRTRR